MQSKPEIGATAGVFFLLGPRMIGSAEAAKVLGVEENVLTDSTEEQLAARGLRKISGDESPRTADGKQ